MRVLPNQNSFYQPQSPQHSLLLPHKGEGYLTKARVTWLCDTYSCIFICFLNFLVYVCMFTCGYVGTRLRMLVKATDHTGYLLLLLSYYFWEKSHWTWFSLFSSPPGQHVFLSLPHLLWDYQDGTLCPDFSTATRHPAGLCARATSTLSPCARFHISLVT